MHRIPMNNSLLRRTRGEPAYQAALIDLAMEGIVDREKVEALLGYKISSAWERSQYAKRAAKEQPAAVAVAPKAVAEKKPKAEE